MRVSARSFLPKIMAKKKNQKNAPLEVVVTEEVLEMNPDLKAEGVEVGETIEVDPLTKDEEAQLKETASKAPKFKVNFGVEIPEMKKTYSKADLEANEEICEYLHEIGSGAVTKL